MHTSYNTIALVLSRIILSDIFSVKLAPGGINTNNSLVPSHFEPF